MTGRLPWLVAALTVSCADGSSAAAAAPFFPDDYASTYVEVRGCRPSGDHNLNNIRILTDPDSVVAYQQRAESFPRRAVVLKEEHDFGDTTCSGPIAQWTVMRRDDEHGPSQGLGWSWQRVGASRSVLGSNEPRCYGCHAACGAPPDGFEGTCALP